MQFQQGDIVRRIHPSFHEVRELYYYVVDEQHKDNLRLVGIPHRVFAPESFEYAGIRIGSQIQRTGESWRDIKKGDIVTVKGLGIATLELCVRLVDHRLEYAMSKFKVVNDTIDYHIENIRREINGNEI